MIKCITEMIVKRNFNVSVVETISFLKLFTSVSLVSPEVISREGILDDNVFAKSDLSVRNRS